MEAIMRKILFLLFAIANIIFAQPSDWQVYKVPYKYTNGTYAFCDNTGTGPFMIWWKKTIGINYSSMPQIIKTGINYAISTQAWGGQSYLSFTSGSDIQTLARYNETRNYFGAGELTSFDSQTGQIFSAELEANMGKYKHNDYDYDLIWTIDGNSYIDEINHKIYLDSRAEMAHELGHALGIFHPKNGTQGETMSTFSQAENAGFNPAQRMYLKSNDWTALSFLYNKGPISNVYLTGDATLYSGFTGHWWVTVENGRLAFTYGWQIMYLDGGGYLQTYESVKDEKEKKDKVKDKTKEDNIIIEVVPSNEWVAIGTNSSSLSKSYNPNDLRDFKLKCIVTDINNSTKSSNEFYVDIVSSPPPKIISNNSYSETTPLAKENEVSTISNNYSLDQNFPNPFNNQTHIQTKIRFQVPDVAGRFAPVLLQVFSINGEKVKTIVKGDFEAGTYDLTWDGTNDNGEVVASGAYLYRLWTRDLMLVKKMMFIK